MGLILDTIGWMSFNIVLACVPVVFGYLLMRAHKPITKIFLGAIWLVFLPNTIYLLTDIIHIFEDWDQPVLLTYKLILVVFYTILMTLGVITFILSLHPLEIIFRRKLQHKTLIIVSMNFLIGFGIVLGRIERTNSWEVFTNIVKVFHDVWNIFTSGEKIILCFVFGLLCNIVYFSCRRLVMQEVHEIEKL